MGDGLDSLAAGPGWVLEVDVEDLAGVGIEVQPGDSVGDGQGNIYEGPRFVGFAGAAEGHFAAFMEQAADKLLGGGQIGLNERAALDDFGQPVAVIGGGFGFQGLQSPGRGPHDEVCLSRVLIQGDRGFLKDGLAAAGLVLLPDFNRLEFGQFERQRLRNRAHDEQGGGFANDNVPRGTFDTDPRGRDRGPRPAEVAHQDGETTAGGIIEGFRGMFEQLGNRGRHLGREHFEQGANDRSLAVYRWGFGWHKEKLQPPRPMLLERAQRVA